jgi:hypothetical protein
MPGVVINAYLLRGLQDGSLIRPSARPSKPCSACWVLGLDYLLSPWGRRRNALQAYAAQAWSRP